MIKLAIVEIDGLPQRYSNIMVVIQLYQEIHNKPNSDIYVKVYDEDRTMIAEDFKLIRK